MSNLYAWAWALHEDNIDAERGKIPGLKLIHYPRTYHKARKGDVAYVNSARAAEKAVEAAAVHGVEWKLATLGDERNVTGPSGKSETVEAYEDRLGEANVILQTAGIETSSCGLGMIGPLGTRFDVEYHRQIRMGDHRGANFRPLGFRSVHASLDEHPSWVLTEIPLRFNPNFLPLKYNNMGAFLIQQLFAWPRFPKQLEILNEDPRVEVVAMWCLRENRLGDGTWQNWHGLIDRNGHLTWQGRLVKRLLRRLG